MGGYGTYDIDKPSSRVTKPPGGGSSINIFGGGGEPEPQRHNRRYPPPPPQQQQQQQQQLQQQHNHHQQISSEQPEDAEGLSYSSEVLTKPTGGIGIKIKIKKAAEPSDKSSTVKKAKRDEEPSLPIQQSSELQLSQTSDPAMEARPQKSQIAQSDDQVRDSSHPSIQSQQRHTSPHFVPQHAQMASKQQQQQ
jgi:hypothetical protein